MQELGILVVGLHTIFAFGRCSQNQAADKRGPAESKGGFQKPVLQNFLYLTTNHMLDSFCNNSNEWHGRDHIWPKLCQLHRMTFCRNDRQHKRHYHPEVSE